MCLFKHKTAYDMRISDWSSDVCSSDLSAHARNVRTSPCQFVIGEASMPEAKLFQDVIRGRRSPRSFLPTPVPRDVLQSVLEDARNTPSNCNYQPWTLHIASGEYRDKRSAEFLGAVDQQNLKWDFPFVFERSEERR